MCADITIQPDMVTFTPPGRRVCVNVTALPDEVQELTETVVLSCTIKDTCLEFASEPHEATLRIFDNTDSE